METVAQWIKQPHGGAVWLHGLDLLGHFLKRDPEHIHRPRPTAYRKSDDKYWNELRKAVEKAERDQHLVDAVRDVESRPRRRIKLRAAEQGDDLNVDAYVEGDMKRLWVRCEREERAHKPARSIIMDGCVPYMDREKSYIIDRHRDAYALALAAQQEGRPCRIVATLAITYADMPELGQIDWHIVLKDWEEQMFPALWACFKDNKTANCVANLLAATVTGTDQEGNGWCKRHTFTPSTAGEEVIVVGSRTFLELSGGEVLYSSAKS